MYTRIRDLREDLDMTQTEMAKILHCSQQAYSQYELGKRDIPTEVLIRLARFHHTTIDYMLGLTDCRTVPNAWNKKSSGHPKASTDKF